MNHDDDTQDRTGPPRGPAPRVIPAPSPGPIGQGQANKNREHTLEVRRVVALESIAASLERYVNGQFA